VRQMLRLILGCLIRWCAKNSIRDTGLQKLNLLGIAVPSAQLEPEKLAMSRAGFLNPVEFLGMNEFLSCQNNSFSMGVYILQLNSLVKSAERLNSLPEMYSTKVSSGSL
jgi:hypothetical protein